MEPLLFVMAILGCGEGDAPCERLAIAPSRYESRAACTAAATAELPRHRDAPYPVVVADCREAGSAPQRLRASDFPMPEPERLPLRQRFAQEGPRSSR